MSHYQKEYNDLVLYFEKNKNRPMREWLQFDSTFGKAGKQGLVGLLQCNNKNGNKCVFKISQYINYLVHHEAVVMKGLKDIAPFCIHFSKFIGTFTCNIDPNARKSGNPFEITTTYPIEKDVLIGEYIDKSTKMYNYIRAADRIHEDVLYASVKQVLMAITIAQTHKQFSHYDLHSNNIMMKKCNKDLVFLYVMDEDNQYCVPSHGSYPVIIDYGFSYISDMQDGPLWPSLAHTDVGFMSDRFDWVADPKLFLVTVSSEMTEKRSTRKARRLRRIVKNIFAPLTIDWDCGWDDVSEKGASDYVLDLLKKDNDCSKLFEEFDHYCIDLLQTLIVLPLEPQNTDDIHGNYTVFLKEWIKIESEITSPFYKLYILKSIVDAARLVRAAYCCKKTRAEAVRTFQTLMYENLNKISKFCNPKKINYERMLCSLLVLAKNIEGVLYTAMVKRASNKEQEYRKLPLQSPEHMYAALEANIPDEYEFNENTTVFIMNTVEKNTTLISLPPQELATINKLHTMVRGTYIYDLYKTTRNT